VRIVVLAGGVGGARFLLGVRAWARAESPDAEITAVVNTGDDMWLTGLRITPDLDSIMYALAGVNDTERGWGRVGESERVSAELQAWGAGWPWFTLGDLDLGAHITRTGWLREGVPLHEVVGRLTARWPLGVRLLPATDDEVETQVRVAAEEAPGHSRTMHFQEWWTRHRAALPAWGFEQRGVETARPAPGVEEAIATADVVLLAPSNPVVSIGTILDIPGMRAALAATTAPVVGVAGIIGGAVVRGMADACLTAIGVETAADAVARWYGPRSTGGVLDGWLLAEEDAALAPAVEGAGIRAAAAPLWMRDPETTADIVRAALRLADRSAR
jgi:LPPG:FO 2-phospho-L-lactate transferase